MHVSPTLFNPIESANKYRGTLERVKYGVEVAASAVDVTLKVTAIAAFILGHKKLAKKILSSSKS